MEKDNIFKKNLSFTNLLVVVVGVLLTAFFVDFQQWKDERRDREMQMEGRLNLVEINQQLGEKEQEMSDTQICEIKDDIKDIRKKIEDLEKEFGTFKFAKRGTTLNDTLKKW